MSDCHDNVTCSVVGPAEEVWNTLMAVYLGVVLLLALAFNGTVCLVFFKKPHLLSVSNCFVLNLSCCQLGFSILVLPFSLSGVVSRDWIYADTWCDIQAYLCTAFIVTIQLSLLVVSLDRNFAIINSLRYPYVFTQTLCNGLIAATWLLGMVMAFPPLIGFGEYSYQRHQYMCSLDWSSNTVYLTALSVACFLVPVLIQTWCYVQIFRAAVGHTRRNKVYPSVSRSNCRSTFRDAPSDSSESSDSINSANMNNRATECKAVRTIFLIALAYCICWIPYYICSYRTMMQAVPVPSLHAASICLVFSTSVLNPVIYAYMNRVTRREIGRFLCGTPAVGDNDDFVSTSMSTFSSAKTLTSIWTSQQRIRSRSTGGIVNGEMDTIQEEAEVDEVCETRSENDAPFALSSASSPLPQSAGDQGIILDPQNLPSVPDNVSKETSPTKTNHSISQGKRILCKAHTEDIRESNWNIVRSEKFIEERRKCSTGDSYFKKERRRKRRDCGSFLYFESDVTKVASKQKPRKQKQDRFSVDHVQRISINTVPSPKSFKLQISVTDVDRQTDTVRVDSNVQIESHEMEDIGTTRINMPGSPLSTDSCDKTSSNSALQAQNDQGMEAVSIDNTPHGTPTHKTRRTRKPSVPPTPKWSNQERWHVDTSPVTDLERKCYSA